jgi:hypothetical protein
MPDLQHCLNDHDLGFLEIVADLWGVDLAAPDARRALPRLSKTLLDPGLVLEVVEALPENAREALDALLLNDGWLPWSRFTREYGSLREVGPGRRDREKPHLDPISTTEVLWYRALIGRDFLRKGGELEECAYIPDEFLELLPPVKQTGSEPPGRPASPGEISRTTPVTDRILDHCCTLLAALRMGDPERSPDVDSWQPSLHVVHALLGAVKLITSEEQPIPEDARPFLEMPRGEALAWLVGGWRNSELFNELWMMPGVTCEGAWRNDPRSTREKVLALMSEVPDGVWWNLESFINAIFQREPDFQRPAGDFDSWLIRDPANGESLSGLKHWQVVDGALIRYLITGPMHWLGLVDLASPINEDTVAAFRFSDWAENLLLGKPVTGLADEDQPLEAFSNGRVTAGRLTSRLARYQVSRFCLWLSEDKETYTYLLSPAALQKAAAQGLKVTHLETLFNRYGETPPPSLIEALQHWEQKGGQARIHPCVILRVEDPKILQALRGTSAERFLGDLLGPATVIVHPGAIEKVRAALARLGYLSDVDFTGEDDAPTDEAEL